MEKIWKDDVRVVSLGCVGDKKICINKLKEKGVWDGIEHYKCPDPLYTMLSDVYKVKELPFYIIIDPNNRFLVKYHCDYDFIKNFLTQKVFLHRIE